MKDWNSVCEQVYDCDGTGINWKTLPNKTLASIFVKTVPRFQIQLWCIQQ